MTTMQAAARTREALPGVQPGVPLEVRLEVPPGALLGVPLEAPPGVLLGAQCPEQGVLIQGLPAQ